MADTKVCEQCGTSFAPRREHAPVLLRPLPGRLEPAQRQRPPGRDRRAGLVHHRDAGDHRPAPADHDWDRANGFAVISEAVWWVTMVDATLMRYHPDIHGRVLQARTPPSTG